MSCPEIEDIAAFVDNRLPAAARERILSHAETCQVCSELLTETAQIKAALAELHAEPPATARWPSPARWAVAAALAAILGAFLFLRLEAREPPVVRAAQLVGVLEAHPQLLDRFWRWPIHRGDSEPEVLSRQSFRLGSLLVDAELALRLGQPGRAAPALAAMEAILRQAGLMQAQVEWLLSAQVAATAGVSPPPAELAALEEALTERFLPTELALGKWCEAARLAAAAPEPGFFADRDHGRLLAWLERSGDDLDLEAAAQLARVADAWSDGAPPADAYPELERALGQIQAHYSR